MKKEFIPYQEALALKELGFKEPCFGAFIGKEFKFFDFSNDLNGYVNDKNLIIGAPLYQKTFRWFREKYGLTGLIEVGTQEFSYLIINDKWNRLCGTEPLKFNGTYKEAELECIKKLIEIVKLK